jgi:hypothetical protein
LELDDFASVGAVDRTAALGRALAGPWRGIEELGVAFELVDGDAQFSLSPAFDPGAVAWLTMSMSSKKDLRLPPASEGRSGRER